MAAFGPSATSAGTNAVEYQGADRLRKAPRVVLGDPGAIGDTIDVELAVAECCTHGFKIEYRGAGGIEARISGQAAQTLFGRLGDQIRLRPPARSVERRAVQCVRGARAALIDDDDVAIDQNGRERRGTVGIQCDRGATGTPIDQREGV